MRSRIASVLAFGAALLLRVGAAQADEQRAGQSASQGQSVQESAPREISGRVVEASPSRLFLEHMGVVMEFKIDPDAKFSGGAQSSSDLAAGQEVRTSFTVENRTTNVAKKISVAGKGAPEK